MSVHNCIVLSAPPHGRFIEGYISGTPKPGIVIQVKDVPMNGGRHTWEPYNRAANGDRPLGPIAILDFNYFLGKTLLDAYTDGERCRVYLPQPGDELKMLLSDAATGTGDAFAIGAPFMVQDGTGKLLAATGSDAEPFVAMEAIPGMSADTLCHVLFSGY